MSETVATQKPRTRVPTQPPPERDGNRGLTPDQKQAFADQVEARQKHAKPKTAAKVRQVVTTTWKGICWFGRKIKQGTCALAKAAGWAGQKTVAGAKAGGHGLAYVGYGAGRVVRTGMAWTAIGASWVVGGVVLVAATGVMAVGLAFSYAVYTADKAVHLVCLTVATPHLALRSRGGDNVLAQRWSAFFDSLRLRNYHRISPMSLTHDEDGAAGAKVERQGKGHPTPKQAKRRPARLPAPTTA